MSAKTINAELLSKMFLSGAKNLESKKEYINELNVFPVPDGDTGTNMTLTIMSAAKEVYAIENPTMSSVCKSMSSGSLRGARGNSGVILSQLLRGFTKVVKEYDELDVAIISAGFDKAVETAYKAVMKPKEGTILTVAKAAATKANELYNAGTSDIDEFFSEVIKYSNEILQKTPDMLPVLKEAGVVDSGGQGLVEFLEGAYNCYLGKGIEFTIDDDTDKEAGETRKLVVLKENDSPSKYIYSVSFKILLNNKASNSKWENDFRTYLENIGDAVNVNSADNSANVSLMTDDPGLALQKALKQGMLCNIIIKNTSITDESLNEAKTNDDKACENKEDIVCEGPKKKYGFITVSVGDGIGEVFTNLGADYLIEGGQTMNPSTEDMLNAISKVNAETIFILPNNKNIIMAANQARDMTEDKTVIVIPTKTVPQGITALIGFMPDATPEENTDSMLADISLVKTGQVTYAVRDTVIEGVEIHQDDYMGIGDTGILSNGKDMKDTTIAMIDKMIDESSEIITIYYGLDVSEEDANAIKEIVSSKFDSCDVELQNGGQPIYYYIVSVE